jgi:hypothetical protein
MVKYTGKKSAASFLTVLLGLAWYAGIALGLFFIGLQIYFYIGNAQWPGESMMLQIETTGMIFRFTEGFQFPVGDSLLVYQFTFVLPLIVIGLFIIYHLKKILASLAGEEPFSVENGSRIRYIGWGVIAASFIKAILSFLLGIYFSRVIVLPGLEVSANLRLIDFGGILAGLLILILAEVFRHGAVLQEDQNLTV